MSSCSSSSRSSQRRWSLAGQLRAPRVRDERLVPVAMPDAGGVGLAALGEMLGRVLADRLEQPEARLAGGRLLDPDQALVGEGHQAVGDVAADLRAGAADRLRRLEVEAPGEDRAPVEEPPGAVVEEVVAPGDGAAERLLARRQVAGARRRGRRAGAPAGRGSRPGDRSFTRAAASSIASGIPWSRALIAATAGAFSLVTVNPGRTATARSMNSRTAAYWPTAAASSARAPPGRLSRSSDDSSDGSGGVGSPGIG